MELHYDYVNGKQLIVSHARDENTGVRGNTTILYNYREVGYELSLRMRKETFCVSDHF